MERNDLTDRRTFLLAVLLASVSVSTFSGVTSASASDDDDGGGSDDSGSSDSDGDDGGSSDSGGSDNDDDDDGGSNSGSGGSSSGSGSGSSSRTHRGTLSAGQASEAVRKGRAMPLAQAIELFNERYDGRIVDIALENRNRRLVYRFKFREENGRVRRAAMDARNGRFLNFLGF